MPKRLTETAIRAEIARSAEEGRRDLSDAGLPGLRLRLTTAGTATWALACRDQHGRMRRFPLGSFPAMGLGEAREKARALRVRVREEGADPVAERRRQRAAGRDAKAGIGTLGALLEQYRAGRGKELKSWREAERRIGTVFALHLPRPLPELRAGDLQMTADGYPARQSAAAAVRYLRPVLKWGARRGYVAAEITLVEPPATVKRRNRVLTCEELTALLPALSAGGADPYCCALRFMLLTLARREEVAATRWRGVDLAAAEWRIPETKNGTAHRLPLLRQALALLRTIGPSEPGALVFRTQAKRGGDGRLVNKDRETKRLMQETGTVGWTHHDLRRTGVTMLSELGIEPHVVEAALNHAAIHSRLAATYNQARYLPAVRDTLQLLADRLDPIVEADQLQPSDQEHYGEW